MPLLTQTIASQTRDIGFPVRRLLPTRQARRVGPFVFLDHMGPAHFAAEGSAGDVRPHPHIGLATVTYLFSGAMMHRDSLGTVQRIEPGAVNLMTAGSGITHSERVPADIRRQGAAVEGMQLWLALPDELEECEPAFAHYPAEDLPRWEQDGVELNLLMGEGWGRRAPVAYPLPVFYASAVMQAGARLALPEGVDELAAYVAAGELDVDGAGQPALSGLELRIQPPRALGSGPRGLDRPTLPHGAGRDRVHTPAIRAANKNQFHG